MFVLVYPGYMGINKRGVLRGKCSESECECECEEFESVSSIVCGYCGHPPVKHEKHRDISHHRLRKELCQFPMT